MEDGTVGTGTMQRQENPAKLELLTILPGRMWYDAIPDTEYT